MSKNEKLETLLSELSGILEPAEKALFRQPLTPEFPMIYIVGNSRSGSTMLLQWLADSRVFCYPTNLMSRFYAAPYIGGKIQQLLTDPEYQCGDEFGDLTQRVKSFKSDLGKTSGMLAPHEFWYFWRRFIPIFYLEWMTPEQESLVDCEGLRTGLASIQKAFQKPLAIKGKMFNFSIQKLYSIYERSVFIHIHRNPVMNGQSIFLARKKAFGNVNEWFGVRPPQYSELIKHDPYAQIAGQVYFVDREIRRQLSYLSPEHVVDLQYEEFCKNPAYYHKELCEKLAILGFSFESLYQGPSEFQASETIRMHPEDFARLQSAIFSQYET